MLLARKDHSRNDTVWTRSSSGVVTRLTDTLSSGGPHQPVTFGQPQLHAFHICTRSSLSSTPQLDEQAWPPSRSAWHSPASCVPASVPCVCRHATYLCWRVQQATQHQPPSMHVLHVLEAGLAVWSSWMTWSGVGCTGVGAAELNTSISLPVFH